MPSPRPAQPSNAGITGPFSFPDFRRLWTGAFLSSIGTWTQDVALSWIIHTRYANPFYLGLRSFAGEAPLLAFMLLGGAVADRVDRRRILLTSQFVQMGFAALLAFLYAFDQLSLSAILLAGACVGLAQSQSAPTYQAVITGLVPPRQIPNAVALNSLQFNLSRAVGPALAGLLLARVGAGACLAVNALSFLGVIVALQRVVLPPPNVSSDSLSRSLRVGLRHVWHDPLLRLFTVMSGVASFLAFPLITYLPVLAGDVLGTGAGGYSLLLSSYGAGAIVGALATARRGHVAGRGRIMLGAFAAQGVASLAALNVSRQGVAMALLALAGFCMVTAMSTLNSLVQERAPLDVKGRVVSIYGVAFRGGGPLGNLLAGAVAARAGVVPILSAYSLIILALALWLFARSKHLRQV